MRQVLKYPGSKWNIAEKLTALIPEHHSYVEPYFGERMYALWNWYRLPEWIINIAERLRMVQIECRPALEVIKRFNYPNVFQYLDPPYLFGTRNGKQYKYEMTDTAHEDLLKVAVDSKAKIMISGYESDLYNDYLKGWHKKYFTSCAEHNGSRTEVVWMNYQIGQMHINDFDIRGEIYESSIKISRCKAQDSKMDM